MGSKAEPLKIAETIVRQHEVFMSVDPSTRPGMLDVGFFLGDIEKPDFDGMGTGRTIEVATRRALWELYTSMGDAFNDGDLTQQGTNVFIALKRGLKGG